MKLSSLSFILIFPYALVMLQTSIFSHFSIWGITFPLVILFVLILAFFERPFSSESIFAAFFGGLVLDIYSEYTFGLFAIILSIAVFCIKFILRNYVRFSTS